MTSKAGGQAIFLAKVYVYSTSFRNKSNACFSLISNSWKNGRWRPRWRPWLVTSQTSREERGGGGGVTLRVRPRVKNSRTPDHQLICLTKSSLALFTPCPLPDGGKLSLWHKLWAIVDYLRVQWPGHSHREKETKLWWKKFKIKRLVSCCDETWDFRSIEGKDKLSADPLTAI